MQYFQEQEQPQLQHPILQQQSQPNQPQTFSEKIIAFLTTRNATILTFIVGICIGNSFKDLIQNTFTNVVQPLIIQLLVFTNMYDISYFSEILSSKNRAVNFASFLSSAFSFIMIVIITYLVYNLIK
jgi:large-conductance mechanosensitive channel